ncbi:MAG: sialidase family protein [Planctomycetota bacterium]
MPRPPHNKAARRRLLGGIALGALALPLPAQKQPDVRVDRDAGTSFATLPKVAASGPNVYVVWEDGRSGARDIYFTRSPDRGATWAAADVRLDTDIAGSAVSALPRVAASGRRVYVTWLDERNGQADIYFNRSLDGGITWLAADVRLDTDAPGSAFSADPQIAVVGSNVYVVWADNRSGVNDVYCNRSLDGGTTWLRADVRLDTGPATTDSELPQLAADGNGVWVAWWDTRNGNGDVFCNYSRDRGTTWLAQDVRLDTNAPGATPSAEVQIAASDDAVYVTWRELRGSEADVYLNRSLDGGATWLPADVRLDTDPAGSAASFAPQIVATGPHVYVVWQDFRNGLSNIYLNRSPDAGTTWLAADVRIDTSPPGSSLSIDPRIAVAGHNVYVTWEDFRDRGIDIFVSRSLDDGRTWLGADVRLDTDPRGAATSLGPNIAAAGDAAYVIWEEYRRGDADVHCNVPFALHPYGTAASPSAIAPELAGTGEPWIGGEIVLRVAHAPGGAAAALLVGGPGSQIALPWQGGTLWVMPSAALPLAIVGPALPGAGRGEMCLPIPDDPALIGANANFQALIDEAPTVSLTNAVELWIG